MPSSADFVRGFGCALASIWKCQHDGQLVRQLLKENGFTLDTFRNVGMLETDWAALCVAVRK